MTHQDAGASITAVRQIALTVSDVARSVEFYRDALGLPFLFSAGPTLAFLDIGGMRLMLSGPEGEFTPGASAVIYLLVGDIEAAHREMVTRGVKFSEAPRMIAKMPDHDLWLAAFQDLDGNHLALMCEQRGAVRES